MQKSRHVAVIGVLSVLVLALALNPSAEQHRAQIKAAIAERSPIAGALGIGSLTAFTSTYHSLGVASYTTANDKTVSVGALGVVVVTP
jgi:Tfp pilus assembly protein PilV